MPAKTVGKNISFEIKGKKLLLEVDLTQEFGLSKSEKNVIIASSEGNTKIHNEKGEHIGTLGLNFYRPK